MGGSTLPFLRFDHRIERSRQAWVRRWSTSRFQGQRRERMFQHERRSCSQSFLSESAVTWTAVTRMLSCLSHEGAAVPLQTDSLLRSLCYSVLPVCFVGGGGTLTWEIRLSESPRVVLVSKLRRAVWRDREKLWESGW